MGCEMSLNANRAPAASGAFRRPQSTLISANFALVCLWAFLGLDLTALAIALGFGGEIAEFLGMAG